MESKIQGQFGTFPHVKQGLKKDDGMDPVLFNVALEYVIRKLQQTENKHLCTNSHGFFCHSDDRDLRGRPTELVKEVFTALEVAGRESGLRTSENKIKVLIRSRRKR
jgi:hypothetical protein